MSLSGGNESGEFVKEFYTGKTNAKVVVTNPTMAEKLTVLGYTKVDKEPTYTAEKDGVKTARIEFHLETKDGQKLTHSFFVENATVVSKDGNKTQYVNSYGQFAYLPNDGVVPENMAWYPLDGKRAAFKGEEDLMNFLIAWKNVKKGENFQFANFAKMFTGDFTEVKSLTSANSVGLFAGVKKGFDGEGVVKFSQVVYPKLFVRGFVSAEDKPNPKGKPFKGWVNAFTESLESLRANGGQLSTNYGTSPYVFTKVEPTTLSWLTGDGEATATTTEAAVTKPAF